MTARTKDDMNISAKAKWLFGIVVLRFEQGNNKNESDLYIFGRKYKNKKTPEAKKSENAHKKESIDIKLPVEKTIQNEVKQNNEKEIKAVKKKKGFFKFRKNENKKEKSKKDINKKEKRQKFLLEVINYPYKRELIDQTVLLIKRSIAAVKPKYFYLNGEVGFDSPNLTGLLLAAVGIVRGFNGMNVDLTGNLEKETLDAELKLNGRTSLLVLIIPTVRYIASRPVRAIIKSYLSKR